MKLLIIVSFFIITLGNYSNADELNYINLKNLGDIVFDIPILDEDLSEFNKLSSIISNVIQTRLRESGIQYTALEYLDTFADSLFRKPALTCSAGAMKTSDIYVYTMSLKIRENARIQRTFLKSYVVTWDDLLYTVSPKEKIYDSVRLTTELLMDKFLNDYYRANP